MRLWLGVDGGALPSFKILIGFLLKILFLGGGRLGLPVAVHCPMPWPAKPMKFTIAIWAKVCFGLVLFGLHNSVPRSTS